MDEVSAIDTVQPVRTTDGPQSIHPAIRKVWIFSGLFGWLAMMAPLAVPAILTLALRGERFSAAGRIGLLAALIVGPLAILAFILGKINAQWRNWRYEVREYDIMLRWGVFWRTERNIPRDRVQHVDINSGPLDRRFGLVQVSLHTAGSPAAVGVIPGLTEQQADDLKEMILESQARHV